MTSRRYSDAAVGTAHAQTLHANLVSAYAVQCPPLVWAEAHLFLNSRSVYTASCNATTFSSTVYTSFFVSI